MAKLKLWLRVVGVFYLVQFVLNVFVQAPIRAMGPKGALDQAAAGDPLARFLVDTWVISGLEVGAIGAALLLASRRPEQASVLVWTIIGIELARGIIADIYMVARGNDVVVAAIWIVIHSAVIVTGFAVLRSSRAADGTNVVPTSGR